MISDIGILDMIYDLMELEKVQGNHQGRWQYCMDKETAGDEYLDDIAPFAKAYGVEYDDDLENNFSPDEWVELTKFDKGYAMDELGFRIYSEVKEMLVNEIKKRVL